LLLFFFKLLPLADVVLELRVTDDLALNYFAILRLLNVLELPLLLSLSLSLLLRLGRLSRFNSSCLIILLYLFILRLLLYFFFLQFDFFYVSLLVEQFISLSNNNLPSEPFTFALMDKIQLPTNSVDD